MPDTYVPIGDYGIIGDCSCAGLVSKDGSIDWLCWPTFDSPAFFSRLLDAERGGAFRLGPAARARVTRRYVDETNVLETTFQTSTGSLRITDLVYAASKDQYHKKLLPEHQLLRTAECLSGRVDVELSVSPRPDFGRSAWRCDRREGIGFVIDQGAAAVTLRSEMHLRYDAASRCILGTSTLRAGECVRSVLSFDRDEPSILPPLGAAFDGLVQDTLEYWRSWSRRCTYEGPLRAPVVRSALTLKLLASSATGAVVAAPTTSLPEKLGGVRNWDYRFCWLRDAAFTLRALMDLGYREEGEAFFGWLSYTARQAAPYVDILYTIHGGTDISEEPLEAYEGYAGSAPVRLGNDAGSQFQLDVYGEVITAAFDYVQRGGRLTNWQRKLLVELGETICRRWTEKDNGIWEKQSERCHHTHSKVMCWTGLDLLLRLQETEKLDLPPDLFEVTRAEIARAVEERGLDAFHGSYSASFDHFEMDASLLLLPFYAYVEADDERMATTFAFIRDELGTGDLLYRYKPDGRDGLPAGEGAFGICSFWAVEFLALRGDVDEARDLFNRLLHYSNDLGLLSEEIDPDSGRLLGNFPQALTHVGLINAALTLSKSRGTPAGARPKTASRSR